ncbi:MAG: CHAT domain-containing protein, partial [Flavobacteriaceae bacterium]
VDNEKLLAFAPSFNGQEINASASRDKLSPLPHNITETARVVKLFKGDVFEGERASLQNFSRHVQEYGMLHLATHAVFNNHQPEYSYLAFAPDGQERLLFVKDLYNLELNMDMVTLSACETALGDLKRGEGFIGLASGFFYAGAKSITSTLWKVNDASTASLMGDFYETLAKGHTKGVALQKAQKLFLKRNADNARAHPYYWSGFVLSGNHAPLDPKWPWVWIIAPLLLLLVLIGIFGTGKKTNPNR